MYFATSEDRFDRKKEVSTRPNPPLLAQMHNGPCSRAGAPLFAIFVKDPSQLLFWKIVDQCLRCHIAPRIHPHVERSIPSKTKSPLHRIQLHGGDPNIDQKPIDRSQ